MITNSPQVFSHMTTEDMRRSAKNLRMLAGIFENNAVAATDPCMVNAWDTAMSHILDAAGTLLEQADSIDGVWQLFPEEGKRLEVWR